MGRKALTYQEYLDSDVWKCTKAPIDKDVLLQVKFGTGAHHWKEVQPNPNGNLHTGIFYCIHCFDCKKVKGIYYQDWLKYFTVSQANPR